MGADLVKCFHRSKTPDKKNKKKKNKVRRKSSVDNIHYGENDVKLLNINTKVNKKQKTILIGLENIGATCYMNATLQCLSNTEKLTKYFLEKYVYIKEDTTKKLSNQYCKLIYHLWDPESKKNYYAPHKFKNVISEENPLFAGVNASDSKDLLNFLLERLHQELNTKIIKNEDNNNFNDMGQIQLNEEQIKNIFFEDFTLNYRSIISDLFYLTIETKTKCSNCNNIKYNFQVNFFIEFPLEEVNKYLFINNRLMSLKNINGTNPDINIIDCFDYYQKIDLMTGENRMYCNICKYEFDAYYQTNLYILPHHLIINLNRGKNAAYQCNVFFPEILNLINFVAYKDINTIFELYAVICHIGPSSMSGHFVAYCKNRMDHQWYLYNDSEVTLCKNSNEYRNHMPYILFYQSTNPKKT